MQKGVIIIPRKNQMKRKENAELARKKPMNDVESAMPSS